MNYMDRSGVITLAKAADVALVGGKAASLGKLMRAGFNVPAGFVVINSNEAEILAAFDKLEANLVAVRSSAVAEDSFNDAWAGQFDTFLNVSREELIDKIRAVQNSASTERAKSYAKEKDIKSGKVAVIVQKMVPADISGVAFSAHPVTSNKGQIVVEAVSGLAEKLVSGDVTPDNYVLEKASLKVTNSILTGKEALLDKNELARLGKEIINVEKLYGRPMDIEWSFANGELYILQARPITTL